MKKTNLKIREIKNKAFTWLIMLLTGVTVLPLGFIIFELLRKGFKQINLNFFIDTAPDSYTAMQAIEANQPIPGGIVHGILGTLYMVLIASLIAIPIGLLTGVYLAENRDKKFASLIRTTSDTIQGIPSIVLGIIAYIWVVKPITSSFSALAGGVALAIMMLPLIVRSTEETLKMLPETIKEAGLALGVSYPRVIFKLIIPTAFSGIFTGILLSISRVLGETAPLMLTALGSSMINFDITKPTSAVPLLIWEFYNDPNLINMIWSASLFLMLLVLSLNLVARFVSRKYR
jgi:phosphate transport system permease protein